MEGTPKGKKYSDGVRSTHSTNQKKSSLDAKPTNHRKNVCLQKGDTPTLCASSPEMVIYLVFSAI
jgi:hypothetical protein